MTTRQSSAAAAFRELSIAGPWGDGANLIVSDLAAEMSGTRQGAEGDERGKQ